MVFTCRISATKVQSFEHVILILSFTVETVKVDAVVDMLISISLGRFLIVHCVNVLDGKRHPGHLHGRKGRNMVPSKAVSERCGLGALASFSAESECSGDAVTGRSLCVAVVHWMSGEALQQRVAFICVVPSRQNSSLLNNSWGFFSWFLNRSITRFLWHLRAEMGGRQFSF